MVVGEGDMVFFIFLMFFSRTGSVMYIYLEFVL
jgi:hypothetical protein